MDKDQNNKPCPLENSSNKDEVRARKAAERHTRRIKLLDNAQLLRQKAPEKSDDEGKAVFWNLPFETYPEERQVILRECIKSEGNDSAVQKKLRTNIKKALQRLNDLVQKNDNLQAVHRKWIRKPKDVRICAIYYIRQQFPNIIGCNDITKWRTVMPQMLSSWPQKPGPSQQGGMSPDKRTALYIFKMLGDAGHAEIKQAYLALTHEYFEKNKSDVELVPILADDRADKFAQRIRGHLKSFQN